MLVPLACWSWPHVPCAQLAENESRQVSDLVLHICHISVLIWVAGLMWMQARTPPRRTATPVGRAVRSSTSWATPAAALLSASARTPRRTSTTGGPPAHQSSSPGGPTVQPATTQILACPPPTPMSSQAPLLEVSSKTAILTVLRSTVLVTNM